jgi:uncharacterized membrane protein YfcA
VKTVLFLLVVFGTNVIQGITGFAGTLLAMPPSMMLLGVEPAKAILNAMGLAASLAIVWQDRKSVNVKQLRRMVLFMTLGIVLGLLLLQLVRIDFLLVIYGIFLLVFALFKLFSKGTGRVLSPALGVLILIAAGVIHGMFISGGSLLVIYAVNALPEKKEFRATLSGVWVVLNSLLLIQHGTQGYFTSSTLWLTLICLVPLFLGVKLGGILHEKVNQATFLRVTYVLLAISGGMLLF